jgi:hypothetical protein
LRNNSKELSQNIRNAEYYIMGYYAGLSADEYLSVGSKYGDLYMAYKWAARQTPFTERWVRSNSDIPSSPPGGAEWAKARLQDGQALGNAWKTTLDAKQRKRNYP